MGNLVTAVLLTVSMLFVSGCGYSTASMLPKELDSIHINNFINRIEPTREISDKRSSFTYRPGIDVEITRAVIDGFIFDRRLDIKPADKAALILEGELIDFKEDPLSYNVGGDIEEFRIDIIVNMRLKNRLTGKVVWEENNFSGQTDYTVVGPNAKTEAQAIRFAVKDLAQRVVERVVENW